MRADPEDARIAYEVNSAKTPEDAQRALEVVVAKHGFARVAVALKRTLRLTEAELEDLRSVHRAERRLRERAQEVLRSTVVHRLKKLREARAILHQLEERMQ